VGSCSWHPCVFQVWAPTSASSWYGPVRPGQAGPSGVTGTGIAEEAAPSAKGAPTAPPGRAYQGLRSWTSSDSDGGSEEERRGRGRGAEGEGEEAGEMEVGVAVRGLGFLVPGSPDTMGMLHKQRRRTPEMPPGRGDAPAGSTLGVPAMNLGPGSQGTRRSAPGAPSASGTELPQGEMPRQCGTGLGLRLLPLQQQQAQQGQQGQRERGELQSSPGRQMQRQSPSLAMSEARLGELSGAGGAGQRCQPGWGKPYVTRGKPYVTRNKPYVTGALTEWSTPRTTSFGEDGPAECCSNAGPGW